ncbi:hypothetical protein DFH07DRAFT_318549 [Mycena maculata]|uniref:GST N-terminal domain-containing protein n=1 Tax=Mycena maculata TaxID=230809 RepID=A0AAD7KBX5_9AGAR|nr:hypothetical protein DFH07DRAFT_318549 [Mycena maculata]
MHAIVFYDIASAPPVRPFAVNPRKTRYALNFKRVHYRTEWVELPDIPSVRQKIGAAPVRTHVRDGSPYYTLPVIHDPSTGAVVGDSFDIALYLDKTYPSDTPLFPPASTAVQAAFNKYVDKFMDPFVVLCLQGLPLNPATAEVSQADFCWRAGVERWDELAIVGDERARLLEQFNAALGGELARWYSYSDGPFMEGENPLYADFVVGGWLGFMSVALPAKEWADIQTWQDGLWGRLHRTLQERYAEVK